jgi:hypothetical protein
VTLIRSSLDDFRTFLVQELMTAIGAEKFDLLVPKFLPVTIKLAFALWTGHPKNFCHYALPPGPKLREFRLPCG